MTVKNGTQLGSTVKQSTIDGLFLSGPGEDLVPKLLMQLAAATNQGGHPFLSLFGPYKPGSQQQRWADYARSDWSIRQLPAIAVYEADNEEKQSSNAYVTGSVNIMVLWEPSQRRSDLSRVQRSFEAAVQNFFESKFCTQMLDELYYIQRPMKVYGLNELGKTISWSPNVEGFVENETVPVTLISVKYRIDLRAWYRALEFMNRTKDLPFQTTLSDLKVIDGNFDGVNGNTAAPADIQVVVKEEIDVSN